MKVAVTGHRPSKLNDEYNMLGPVSIKIRQDLQYVIDTLKPNMLISGMALGVDTIWAQLALQNQIQLLAAIPCKNHSSKWVKASQVLYDEILTNSLTTVHYVSEDDYTHTCMQLRNEYMVDECDMLIAIWDGSSGGTANCVRYAERKNKSILTFKPLIL